MPTSPLVSLVMAARQPNPSWFREAIDSALGQQDCRLELVVVDDGSPEPLQDLLQEIGDERMRLVRVPHGGVAKARNAGLELADGDYVRFIDADDVLAPESTARLLTMAGSEQGEAISYGSTQYCDESLRPLTLKTSDLQGWVAEQCLLYRFDVRCMSMLFPRRIVEAVGPWDPALRHCQDWDYVLRALEHAPVRGDQQVASHYRVHPGSQTAKLEDVLRYEQLVVDRYFERHPDQIGTSLERRARAQLLRVRAGIGSSLGDSRRQQLSTLQRAFSMDRRGTAAYVLDRVAQRSRASAGRAGRALLHRSRP